MNNLFLRQLSFFIIISTLIHAESETLTKEQDKKLNDGDKALVSAVVEDAINDCIPQDRSKISELKESYKETFNNYWSKKNQMLDRIDSVTSQMKVFIKNTIVPNVSYHKTLDSEKNRSYLHIEIDENAALKAMLCGVVTFDVIKKPRSACLIFTCMAYNYFANPK